MRRNDGRKQGVGTSKRDYYTIVVHEGNRFPAYNKDRITMHWRTFMLVSLLWLLWGCGNAPPDVAVAPLYMGAQTAQPSDAAMAAEILDGNGRYVSDQARQAAQLYRIDSASTYADVKAYYMAEMTALGWQVDPAIVVEGDTLSYFGWKKDGATFVIGVVEDVAGDGAFLTLALY